MSNREQPACPGLEQGQIIPAFTLPGADGMPHSPWTYKQREHLLLLFMHSTTTDETHALLRIYAQHYADFREEVCAILAISADPVIANLQVQEKLPLPFPLLSDVQGNTIQRYTSWDSSTRALTPCIVLADRYGGLYRRWLAEPETALPAISDVLESLQYLNRLCTP